MAEALCNLSMLPLSKDWESRGNDDYHYLVILVKREEDNQFKEKLYVDMSPTKYYLPMTFPIKVSYDRYNQVQAKDKDLETFFLKELFEKDYLTEEITNYNDFLKYCDEDDSLLSYMFINKLFFNDLIEQANNKDNNLLDCDNVFSKYLSFKEDLFNDLDNIETTINSLEKRSRIDIEMERKMIDLFIQDDINSYICLTDTLLVTNSYLEYEMNMFDKTLLDKKLDFKLFHDFDKQDISNFYLLVIYAKYVGNVFTKARYEQSELNGVSVLENHIKTTQKIINYYKEQ